MTILANIIVPDDENAVSDEEMLQLEKDFEVAYAAKKVLTGNYIEINWVTLQDSMYAIILPFGWGDRHKKIFEERFQKIIDDVKNGIPRAIATRAPLQYSEIPYFDDKPEPMGVIGTVPFLEEGESGEDSDCMIEPKTLHNTDLSGTKKNVPDLKVFGDPSLPDVWQLITKASSELQGWMKSTKAMQVGRDVVIQVTTQQRNLDGSYSLAEALTSLQDKKIITHFDENENVIRREIIDDPDYGDYYGEEDIDESDSSTESIMTSMKSLKFGTSKEMEEWLALYASRADDFREKDALTLMKEYTQKSRVLCVLWTVEGEHDIVIFLPTADEIDAMQSYGRFPAFSVDRFYYEQIKPKLEPEDEDGDEEEIIDEAEYTDVEAPKSEFIDETGNSVNFEDGPPQPAGFNDEDMTIPEFGNKVPDEE